jgi:hypothetical protein
MFEIFVSWFITLMASEVLLFTFCLKYDGLLVTAKKMIYVYIS